MARTLEHLLSIEEVADILGVPVRTLYSWRYRTELTGPRAIRVGRHLRYRPSDVDAWLDAQVDQGQDQTRATA